MTAWRGADGDIGPIAQSDIGPERGHSAQPILGRNVAHNYGGSPQLIQHLLINSPHEVALPAKIKLTPLWFSHTEKDPLFEWRGGKNRFFFLLFFFFNQWSIRWSTSGMPLLCCLKRWSGPLSRNVVELSHGSAAATPDQVLLESLRQSCCGVCGLFEALCSQSRSLGIKLLGRPDGTSLRRGSWKNACSVGCSSELHWGDVIEACTGNCPLCLDTKLSIRAPYFAWKKEKKIECFELNNFHQVVIYEDVTLWFLQVINTIQGIIVGGRWERHRACPSWFILIFIVVSRSHSQRAAKSRSFWGWCNFVFCLLASNFWVFQKSKRWPFSSLSSIQCPGAGTHHHLAQFYEAAQRMHFPMPTVSWDAWGQI